MTALPSAPGKYDAVNEAQMRRTVQQAITALQKADINYDETGTATFPTAGTVSVSFLNKKPDTKYRVALGPQANETFWVTAKTTSGFTLNSSNAASTATVEWIVRR